MTPRGGFCVEQHLPDNGRSITSMTFAPDGRLFLALDSPPTGEADPLVLYDAYHPSRAVAVYDPVSRNSMQEIFRRVAAHHRPRLCQRRRLPQPLGRGGLDSRWRREYQPLAGRLRRQQPAFPRQQRAGHLNGWLYISAGGVRDGYSDGPLVGMDENSAQSIVSGGNGYAAHRARRWTGS